MSDVLAVLAVVAFFVMATLLANACGRITAAGTEDTEREEATAEHGPGAPA